MGVGVLSNFLSLVVLYSIGISPNYSASVYNILLLPLYSWIYFEATKKNYGNLLLGINIGYVGFGIINLLFIQKSMINSYTNIVLTIIIIVYALFYFQYLIRNMPAYHIQRYPMFWINSSLIIFYAGNLILFVFTPYLVEVLNDNLVAHWSFHNILSIVQALILGVAIVVDLRATFRVTKEAA